MKLNGLSLKIAAFSLLLCSMNNAAFSNPVKPSTLFKETGHSKWQFRIAPYIWAINMDGSTQIGNQRAHVNETFSDILSQLSIAGMLWLEANKGDLGLFANGLYSVLKNNAKDGQLSLDAKSQFGLFSAGASYEVYQSKHLAVMPLLGIRYTLNNITLTANTPTQSVRAVDNQHWVDPVIGARLIYAFNRIWSLTLEGDIGGTSRATDYSYNINALFGYKTPIKSIDTSIYFGYRLLDQYYKTGSGANTYLWDMKIAGPLLGIAFDF